MHKKSQTSCVMLIRFKSLSLYTHDPTFNTPVCVSCGQWVMSSRQCILYWIGGTHKTFPVLLTKIFVLPCIAALGPMLKQSIKQITINSWNNKKKLITLWITNHLLYAIKSGCQISWYSTMIVLICSYLSASHVNRPSFHSW